MIDHFFTVTLVYPDVARFLLWMLGVITIGLWVAIKENT